MANKTVSGFLQSVVVDDTNDSVLSFGSFGQKSRMTIFIKVTSGTIAFKLNGDASSGGLSVAAGDNMVPFTLREGVDVLHFKGATGTDAFDIGVSD